jgi:hypothetical protein
MSTEEVIIDGKRVTTLKELLRPGLKAIFVGVNGGSSSNFRYCRFRCRKALRTMLHSSMGSASLTLLGGRPIRPIS